jgi:hypothetical protein
VKRPPVFYVRWSTMWHLVADQGETYCGRFIQPGAERVSHNPGVSMICAICREYL